MKPITSLILTLSLLSAEQGSWNDDILPLFQTYCYDCHGDGLKEGGLNFERFESLDDLLMERGLWGEVQSHLELSLMPPLEESQPTKEERVRLVSWIEEKVFSLEDGFLDPGPRLVRRLNRAEVENSLNDLLDINGSFQKILPADDSGYGYDTISSVLTTSPSHIDKYFQAAEMALEEAFAGRLLDSHFLELDFDNQAGGVGINQNGYYIFPQNGFLYQAYDVLNAGEYGLSVKAGGVTEEVPPLMQIGINGKATKQHFVVNGVDFDEVKTYRLSFQLSEPGIQTFFISLLNRPESTLTETPTGQLQIYDVRLARLDGSPFSFKALGPYRGEREQYFWEQLTPFLSRAFRRPVASDEVARYVQLALAFFEKGGDYAEALKSACTAALVSPEFLYRELPDGNEERELDEFTLASRLSYFLWSTMPDEELLELASETRLRENLDSQIDRMLDSPKSEALIENFFGQWLQLRDLEFTKPSSKHFPDFNDNLVKDMKTETESLIREMLAQDLPMNTLLSSNYSFLNEALATHYGFSNIKGDEFQKVKMPSARFGLLGQGSFLTLTSHPDRTSPVLRGKYILENLLDLTPPPPPQNANQLIKDAHADLPFREQLKLHRDAPDCASCHNLMDPLGFGLEGYDVLGRKRLQYSDGQRIEASGVLYRGEAFDGVAELREQLLTHYQKDYHRSVIKNLLIYALGRGMEWYDRATIAEIYKEAGDDLKARSVIKAVVHSVPFQEKRVENDER